MTSGVKTRFDGTRRGLLAAGLMLAAAPAWAAFDLDALMALLAQRKSGEARFTEERTVSGIEGPLRASGTLGFAAPDRFTRVTLEPRPETMEVQGNQVVLKRGGRTRQMALDAVPEVAALADAMRGTLNGDARALRKHFSIVVEGGPAKWVLRLTPLDTRLAQQVREMEIVGQGADLRSVELRLAGGDRSLMLIEPVSAAAAR